MEDLKENLFYSPSEQLLFYVAGYTENNYEVEKIKEMLDECVKEFELSIPKGVTNPIKTDVITISRRYKYMRYFWVKVEEKFVSKEAFVIGNDWTMSKWLQN